MALRAVVYLFALCVLLPASAFAQTCVAPPPGIVAWWPFDETSGTVAADIIGGKTGVRFGGVTSILGKAGSAVHLNGVNGYIGVADSNLWAFGANDFSIEFWVNFEAGGGSDIGHPRQVFIGNDEGPFTVNKWFFALGGGYLNFHVNGPAVGGHFFPLVPFTPTLNQWYHLAITRSGNLFTIYVNGQAAGSQTLAISIPNANASLTMGVAELLAFMQGSLDEMTIYNRSLTASEIRSIYDAGGAGKCKPGAITSQFVFPTVGGDTGPVSVRVSGGRYGAGTTVRLSRSGAADIPGTPVTITDNGTTVQTTFDLTAQPRGSWDIVVTNPDNTQTRYPGAFSIEEGKAPVLWADLIGPSVFRPGQTRTYALVYGNNGNVDGMARLWLTGVPESSNVKIDLPLPAEPSPDPDTPPNTQSPVLLNMGGTNLIEGVEPNLSPGVSSTLLITVTMPGVGPYALSLYGEMMSADTAKKKGTFCGYVWCMPTADQPGLKRAVEVGRPTQTADPRKGMCVAASVNLDNALRTEIARPGSLLSGWTVEVINGGCGWSIGSRRSHNAVRLHSPLTGRDYFMDNYDQMSLCSLVPDKAGPNGEPRWKTSGCLWSCSYQRDPDLNCSPAQQYRLLVTSGIISTDPNDKIGSLGSGAPKYVSDSEPLRYTVLFENLATATAPAQVITVDDQLDAQVFDLNSLSLGPILFGDRHIIPPERVNDYSTVVDLRPAKKLLVVITAHLDNSTDALRWTFKSIDPDTMKPPDDPFAGFLPPNNNSPEGDGSVAFTVMPKQWLATGSQIRNQASIVFDVNPPISTPEWLNTIDNTTPVSKVSPLPATASTLSFPVIWSGTDVGSGVESYTIYASDNAGAFTPWLSATTATQGTYTGVKGHTYRFYSITRDLVGNVEGAKSAAEAMTTIVLTNIAGDVNGDGKVDCADIAIVREAFGKKTGQPGWDVRADVVVDGVIDVRDLAFVSQRLPAGTKCQ